MSSELFLYDNSFFSDPFSAFTDSTIQILEEDTTALLNDNPVDELDQIASLLLSSSPPSGQLQSLSLSQGTVKTEECQLNFDPFPAFGTSSFDALRLMQRSYSSNSFDDNKHTQFSSFQPLFDTLLEPHTLQPQILTSPETATGQIRRVCSTGDLQLRATNSPTTLLSSSPLSSDKSFMEEANFKVGRYSAEERKERIDRYRAKRTQRNFHKTIKYACRKTLADTRPRIRGRFARNDEAGETPKASSFQRYEDEDDLWMDGFHEEDDDGNAGRGMFFNMSGYHNYSYRNFE